MGRDLVPGFPNVAEQGILALREVARVDAPQFIIHLGHEHTLVAKALQSDVEAAEAGKKVNEPQSSPPLAVYSSGG
jgi:hypothetical protein